MTSKDLIELTSTGGLDLGDELIGAVKISLFSDSHVDAAELPAGMEDQRGWWADTYSSRPIGSKLWLLSRSKRTEETVQKIKTYAQQALSWIITEGLASHIDITAAAFRDTGISLMITIYKGNKIQTLEVEV